MTGFAGWAYMSRVDYKENTDAKVADAVVIAKQQESTAKDKQFVEKEKNPLRTYQGPDTAGSVTIMYPKTWSAYVEDGAGSANPLNGYFHPATVPATSDQKSLFALHVEVTNQSYAQTIAQYASQQKSGKVAITPYALPKVPSAVGVKVSGTLSNNKVGTVVVLPLRAQTVKLTSEGTQWQGDFNNIILPNASFLP